MAAIPDPSHRHRWLRLSLLALVASLTSCATIPELGALADRGGTSGRRIEVDLTDQKATLLHHGKVVAISPICTARVGKTTPAGRYSIIRRSPDHRCRLCGNCVRGG